MSEIGYGIEVHKAVVHVEDAHTLGAGLSTHECVLHGIEEPPKQLTADDIPETATRFWLTDALKTLWNAASTWVDDIGKKHVADKVNPHETSISNIKGYPETPTGKRYLNDLGAFDTPSVGGGGGGSPIYLSNVASDVPGYKKLSSVPDAAEVIKTITASNSTVYGETYLFDLPIDLSVVNAGQWVFDYWRAVSSAAQESYARIESFLRHADGTETTTYTVESPSIEDTTLSQRIITYTLQQFTALPTDRFGVRLSFRTTINANITYSYIVGGLRGHSIISPVPPRHDYLRDKDGNPEFQHISATEKNKLDRLLIEFTVPADTPSLSFDRDKNGVLFSDLNITSIRIVGYAKTPSAVNGLGLIQVNGISTKYNNDTFTSNTQGFLFINNANSAFVSDLYILGEVFIHSSLTAGYTTISPQSNYARVAQVGINNTPIIVFSKIVMLSSQFKSGSSIKIYRND